MRSMRGDRDQAVCERGQGSTLDILDSEFIFISCFLN